MTPGQLADFWQPLYALVGRFMWEVDGMARRAELSPDALDALQDAAEGTVVALAELHTAELAAIRPHSYPELRSA